MVGDGSWLDWQGQAGMKSRKIRCKMGGSSRSVPMVGQGEAVKEKQRKVWAWRGWKNEGLLD